MSSYIWLQGNFKAKYVYAMTTSLKRYASFRRDTMSFYDLRYFERKATSNIIRLGLFGMICHYSGHGHLFGKLRLVILTFSCDQIVY